MTASINLTGVPVLSFAGQSYSEHQRNDWDTSAFARLFDQTDGPSARPVGEGKDTSERNQNQRAVEPISEVGYSASSARASDTRSSFGVDVDLPDQRIGALADDSISSRIESGGEGLPADIPSVRGINGAREAFESAKTPEVALMPASSPSDTTPAEVIVMAGMHKEMVHVSIRDARVKAWQLPQLLSKIRTELSWHGMAVGAISINGSNVYQAPDMNSSVALNIKLQQA